jgi:hypothetical protein
MWLIQIGKAASWSPAQKQTKPSSYPQMKSWKALTENLLAFGPQTSETATLPTNIWITPLTYQIFKSPIDLHIHIRQQQLHFSFHPNLITKTRGIGSSTIKSGFRHQASHHQITPPHYAEWDRVLTASGPSVAIWGGWWYRTPAACACNLVCIDTNTRKTR